MIDLETFDPAGTALEAKKHGQGYLWDSDKKKWVWQRGVENAKKGILITMVNGVPYDNDGNPISLMAGVQLPESIIAGQRTRAMPGVELPAGRNIPTATQQTGQVVQKWINCTPAAGNPIVVDWERGNRQFAVLAENKVVILLHPKDQTCCLVLRQNLTGNFTVTWNLNDALNPHVLPACFWPGGETPVMTVTAEAQDMYSFVWINDWQFYLGMTTQDMRVPTP
jgi:hypothetical protein